MIIVRPRKGKWQCDITLKWPDGTSYREQRNAPVASKSGALRWAQDRERFLLDNGPQATKTRGSAFPTLAEFWPRVLKEHYEANRRTPSTIDAAKTVFNVHLVPLHGVGLDCISDADVARIKANLTSKKPRTVNNTLSVLSVVLNRAVEWKVIPRMPCEVRLVKVPETEMEWFRVGDYRERVEAARAIDLARFQAGKIEQPEPRREVFVLLLGSGGLRRGELRALSWKDVDFTRQVVHVNRAFWRGVEGPTKGKNLREVPMTPELHDALKSLYGYRKHGKRRVLYTFREQTLSNRTVRNWSYQIEKRLGAVENMPRDERTAKVHVYRHTFCSHLAQAGVPAMVIQRLAGHADLKTTMKYMHLAPENQKQGIEKLDAFYGLRDLKSESHSSA